MFAGAVRSIFLLFAHVVLLAMTMLPLQTVTCNVVSPTPIQNDDARVAMYHRQKEKEENYVCNIDARKRLGCAKEVVTFRGKMDCILECEEDEFCIGVSMDGRGGDIIGGGGGMCFLHEKCPARVDCTKAEEGTEESPPVDGWYWLRYCVHGRWDKTTRGCVCRHGCHGDRCDKYVTSCGDLIKAGYSTGLQFALLDPDGDGRHPLKIQCFLNTNYFHVTILRNAGGHSTGKGSNSFLFNRTWDDYVNGFYEGANNFWTGLRNWHSVSRHSGCISLYSVFKYTSSYEEKTIVYRRYDNFVVNGNTENYSFSFSSSQSNRKGTPPSGDDFGDCLGPLQNVPFSTWDQDNDGSSQENCAAWRGSGWWYSGCDSTCNLLGWGLDDWKGTPPHQRLAVPGVDMDRAKDKTRLVQMYLICGITV